MKLGQKRDCWYMLQAHGGPKKGGDTSPSPVNRIKYEEDENHGDRPLFSFCNAQYSALGFLSSRELLCSPLILCPLTSCLGLRCLCSLVRAPEAFVSIQLEKVGLRDMMLNAFLLRKQTMADRMKSLVSLVRRAPWSSRYLLHLSQ